VDRHIWDAKGRAKGREGTWWDVVDGTWWTGTSGENVVGKRGGQAHPPRAFEESVDGYDDRTTERARSMNDTIAGGSTQGTRGGPAGPPGSHRPTRRRRRVMRLRTLVAC
jgi:hypothetical protein